MTFKERLLRGDCRIDAIEDWAELWHTGSIKGLSLKEHLGLTEEEYQLWLTGGNQALAEKLRIPANTEYIAVYLGWDALRYQLENLVQQLLHLPCKITIKRTDYYFWDMSLDVSKDVDEKLSAEICERLELQEVDPDHFLDDDSVDNNQMLSLLRRLTHREVTSSHADDYGVWIICKNLLWSSPEFIDGLLTGCENRLRREILSKRYPTVTPDTAAHQLFGFKEALTKLGLLDRNEWIVVPDHFADLSSAGGKENEL